MRRRGLHRALIASAAVLFAAPAARADQLPRVGVAVSVEVNIPRPDAEKMGQALGQALHKKLMVDVIAGTEAARRLPDDGVADDCIVDRACIADVGQRLSADQILFLVVVRVGSRIQVDATWADPATGRTVSRPAVVIERAEDAETKFAEAAARLLPEAAPRTAAPVAEQPDPSSGPVGPAAPEMVSRQRPRRMTTGAWIAAGVGSAALIGAVSFTLVTRSDYKDCDASSDCSNARLDSLENKALAADLLWGAALASGAAVGVLYWMSGGQIEQVPAGSPPGRSPPGRATRSRGVTPWASIGLRPGPGTIGLAVGGRL